MEGTRQVFTYTELLTEEQIEEYVNDELIDQPGEPPGGDPHRAHLQPAHCVEPLGHARHHGRHGPQSGRTTRVATDIVDIINYHAAPVTVIIGARASNLEKGTNQTWSIPNKDAKVENLLFDPQGIEMSIKYLEVLKQAMHEMTGVPVTALGEEQAISNTSGVALAIQYQPLMNRFHLKETQYGEGFAEVNRLALKTLFMKEPETLVYNPEVDPPVRDDQLPMLDPMDPVTYANTVQSSSRRCRSTSWSSSTSYRSRWRSGWSPSGAPWRNWARSSPTRNCRNSSRNWSTTPSSRLPSTCCGRRSRGFTVMNTGMVPPDGPQPMPPPPANGNGDSKSGNGGGVKSAGGPNVNPAAGAQPPSGVLPGMDVTNAADIKKMFDRVVALSHGTVLPQRRAPEEARRKHRSEVDDCP